MARPSPDLILNRTWERPKTAKNKRMDWRHEEVLEAEGAYAVLYDGKPFNLRESSDLIDDSYKYKRTLFVTSGSAFNLRDKLNEAYHTDKFQVVKYTTGDIIDRLDDTLES